MLVNNISPAPRSSISLAHATASNPVARLPPWLKTFHFESLSFVFCLCVFNSRFLASIATTIHCEPKRFAPSVMRFGLRIAEEFTDTLSAPAVTSACMSSSVEIPPPIVKGINNSRAKRVASSIVVPRFSLEAVMSRKTSSSADCSL